MAKAEMAIKVPKLSKPSKAAEWIASMLSKETWTKGALAKAVIKEDDGTCEYTKEVKVKNPKAEMFCSLGWIQKANQGHEKALKQAIGSFFLSDEDILDDLEYYDDLKTEAQKKKAIEKYRKTYDYDDYIIDFNDSGDTSVKEVRALFRKAAKKLAKESK